MQWAEGGRYVQVPRLLRCLLIIAIFSLDDFIDARQGRPANQQAEPRPSHSSTPEQSRAARIKAFRALQRAPPEERERLRAELMGGGGTVSRGTNQKTWTPVHLLSAEEVRSLFGDMTEGLAFLVN
jgi:hypothetical protein